MSEAIVAKKPARLVSLDAYRGFVMMAMATMIFGVMAELMTPWVRDTLKTHFGATWYDDLGGVYGPILEMSAAVLVLWLICLWMYRRKIFLRI